jgi:hypothetical protein
VLAFGDGPGVASTSSVVSTSGHHGSHTPSSPVGIVPDHRAAGDRGSFWRDRRVDPPGDAVANTPQDEECWTPPATNGSGRDRGDLTWPTATTW